VVAGSAVLCAAFGGIVVDEFTFIKHPVHGLDGTGPIQKRGSSKVKFDGLVKIELYVCACEDTPTRRSAVVKIEK
jgi:hypothetical protein